jgi:hypothetical protein
MSHRSCILAIDEDKTIAGMQLIVRWWIRRDLNRMRETDTNSCTILSTRRISTFFTDNGNRKSVPPWSRKPQWWSIVDRSNTTGTIGNRQESIRIRINIQCTLCLYTLAISVLSILCQNGVYINSRFPIRWLFSVFSLFHRWKKGLVFIHFLIG